MGVYTFSSSKLKNMNKSGRLKADTDGYYTVPIGALNSYNSMGHYYTLEGAARLFEGESSFMHKVNENALYGENGHPKPQGLTETEYAARLTQIHEDRICVHFKEVWLDDQLWKKNSDLLPKGGVAIMAKAIPSGEKKSVVTESFSNPSQNSCFSIRGITHNRRVGGRILRTLTKVFTFDHVWLPGIKVASKYNSPTLESKDDIEIDSILINNFRQAISSNNDLAVESAESYQEIINTYERGQNPSPIYMR